ncbi:matE family protein [Vagococcus sp. BWB3-3]|uniref:Probable multidrug resistance protein NorM n=1 Tax=Vagococcus allomyrinae TaxID=2794353 RepID=A0A940PET7_9ENTE|nr:MATE family efflux transporter [Vagococcus allomyrinae]MBP1042216.1 matE family protein [Vagococcus allomyrinae]
MTKLLIKELNQVAYPLFFNSLLGIVINVLLTAIIGRISPEAIGITEVVDGLIYSFIGVVGAGSISFNIYASRIRKQNPMLFQDYFKSILLLNLLLGILGSLVMMLCVRQLLNGLYDFSGENLTIGTSYGRLSALKLVIYVIIFSFSNQLKVNKKSHLTAVVGGISSIVHLMIGIWTYSHLPAQYQLLGIGVASLVSLTLECGIYCVVLRKDLKPLMSIKSSKKLFLFKKSIPLFGQECLEGAVFSLVFTAFLSRLSISLFAAYSLCLVVVKLAQTTMFPYANSQLILIGEALGEKRHRALTLLPRLTTGLIFATYLSISLFALSLNSSLLVLLSNQVELVQQAQEILPLVLVIFASQLFFESHKYSLQALGKEKSVLVLTGLVNGLTVSVLGVLQVVGLNSLVTILSGLAFNYIFLGLLFSKSYQKVVRI